MLRWPTTGATSSCPAPATGSSRSPPARSTPPSSVSSTTSGTTGADMPAPWPLRFGVFFAPFHPVGQNPTLALEYDLERTVALDRLGFDEVWFGEHHSGGYEIISSPEVFIAAAAE